MACIVNSIKAFKERDLAVKDLSNYVNTKVSVCDICKDHERCQENEENWHCDWKWRGVPDD